MYSINNLKIIKLFDNLIGGSSVKPVSNPDESNTSFISSSTKELVPILFTYLDGKLSSEYGSNQKRNLKFLERNGLFNINQDNFVQFEMKDNIVKDITLLSEIYSKNFNKRGGRNSDDLYYENKGISLRQLKRKFTRSSRDCIELYSELVQKGIYYKKNFYNLLNKYLGDMIKTIKEKKFLFTGSNKHAIAFYLENKGNIYNIVLVNSGDGIQTYHTKIDEDKYNLWKSYRVTEDSIDGILKDILILELIIELDSTKISFKDLFVPSEITKTADDEDFSEDDNPINIIIVRSDDGKEMNLTVKNRYSLIYDTVAEGLGIYSMRIVSIRDEDGDEIRKEEDFWNSYYEKKNKLSVEVGNMTEDSEDTFEINDKLKEYKKQTDKHKYGLGKFYNILESYQSTNIESNFFSERNIENFISKWNEMKKDTRYYIKNFFSSYDLINDDKNLYTNPQKSGTCAWYSIFWLLVAQLIKEDDINPINKIVDMLEKFHQVLNDYYKNPIGTSCVYTFNNNQISLLDYSIINILNKTGYLQYTLDYYLQNIRDIKIDQSFLEDRPKSQLVRNRDTKKYYYNDYLKELLKLVSEDNNIENKKKFMELVNNNDNSFIKYTPYLTQLYVKFYLRNNNFKYSEEETKVVKTTKFTIKDDVIIIPYSEWDNSVKVHDHRPSNFEIALNEEENYIGTIISKRDSGGITFKMNLTSVTPEGDTVTPKEGDTVIIKYNPEIDFSLKKVMKFINGYNYLQPLNPPTIKNIFRDNYNLNYLENMIEYNPINNFLEYETNRRIFEVDTEDDTFKFIKDRVTAYKVTLMIENITRNLKNEEIIRIYYSFYNYSIYLESLFNDLANHSNKNIILKMLLYNPEFFSKLDNEFVKNKIFETIKYNITSLKYGYDKYWFYLLLDNTNNYKIRVGTGYSYVDFENFGHNFNNSFKNHKYFDDAIEKLSILDNLQLFKEFDDYQQMKDGFNLLLDKNMIYKKYFDFDDEDIIYGRERYIKIDLPDNHNFFFNYLNTENSPIRCYFNNTGGVIKYILVNDMIDMDNYYYDNYLVIFIEMKDGKIDKLKFNDFDSVIEDKDIERYPFLIFSPILTNTFILKKGETYYLLILANGYKSKEINILTKSGEIKSGVVILEISNNFLFPKFENSKQIDILKKIYCAYGCKEQVMFNFNLKNKEESYRLINYYQPIFDSSTLDKSSPESKKITSLRVERHNIDNFKYCKKLSESLNNFDESLNFLEQNYHEDRNQILTLLKSSYKVQVVELYTDAIINIDGIDSQDIENFKKNNPNCKLTCSGNAVELNRLIDRLIVNLNNDRYQLSKSINYKEFKDGGIFEIILKNYSKIFRIMQINILLKNIKRLRNIINSCTELNCKDIAEINSYLTVPKSVDRNEINFISLVFELLFGFVIKEEQWKKFNEIYDNYKSSDLRKVTQFMMGKGKSAVITPLLILNLIDKDNKVNIIVPTHLVKQTEKEMMILSKLFNLGNYYRVLNDSKSKEMVINNKFNQNDIFIFDEFDMMFDPIQSNFNYIKDEGKPFFKSEHIDLIVDLIEGKDIDNTNFVEEIKSILETKNFKNINYGMSNSNDLLPNKTYKRWVIPYARKDTPNEGSYFSSLLITLVLTVKYFQENDYYFEERDIINLFRLEYFILDIDDKVEIESLYVLNAMKYQKKLRKEDRIELIKKYINKFIINELKYNESIKNCSFIDLMNSGKWATGFSGTVNIDLPEIKEEFSKFNQTITEDKDENIGVYFALTGTYSNSTNDIFPYSNVDSVYQLLKNKNYNCLIDIAAIFKDYPNKDVVKKVLSIERYSGYSGIYLDNNDNVKIITPLGDEKELINLPEKDIFIFFSQRNIVGTDIKNQPNNLTGLVIIDKNEKYTNVAQGIFRLRKLNKGQTIDIAYNGKIDEDKKEAKINVFKTLQNNDKKLRESKLPFQQLQNLKFLLRSSKEYTHETYLQRDMKPLFIRMIKDGIDRKSLDYSEYVKTTLDNQINWDNNRNPLENNLRDILRGNNIVLLESILFGGNYQEQERERLQDRKEEKEKEQTSDKVKSISKSMKWYLNELEVDKILVFPNNNENLEDILLKAFSQLEKNKDFSLYLSLNLITTYDERTKYFFVELDEHKLLLIPDIFNTNELNNLTFTFDYIKSNMLSLYLRDFPVYDENGDCINNNYHKKGKKENLFYRYPSNKIFLLLRKILRGKILKEGQSDDLTTYLDNIIFKIFVMLLQIRFNTTYSNISLINEPLLSESDVKEFNKYTDFDRNWYIESNPKTTKFEYKYLKQNNDNLYNSIVDLYTKPKIEKIINDITEILTSKINYGRLIFKQQINNIKTRIMEEYGDSDKYIEYIDNLDSVDLEQTTTSQHNKIIKKFIIRNVAYDNNLKIMYYKGVKKNRDPSQSVEYVDKFLGTNEKFDFFST